MFKITTKEAILDASFDSEEKAIDFINANTGCFEVGEIAYILDFSNKGCWTRPTKIKFQKVIIPKFSN